eukprot:gb/GECG01014147.1/.p1 GENE.gb/GECG01014147.1/~~gb/GECG01014147.1/.p1  ORF type:complete len:177 (+),score=31.52 gb/GECG01014147.1/:1-531(+)
MDQKNYPQRSAAKSRSTESGRTSSSSSSLPNTYQEVRMSEEEDEAGRSSVSVQSGGSQDGAASEKPNSFPAPKDPSPHSSIESSSIQGSQFSTGTGRNGEKTGSLVLAVFCESEGIADKTLNLLPEQQELKDSGILSGLDDVLLCCSAGQLQHAMIRRRPKILHFSGHGDMIYCCT